MRCASHLELRDLGDDLVRGWAGRGFQGPAPAEDGNQGGRHTRRQIWHLTSSYRIDHLRPKNVKYDYVPVTAHSQFVLKQA